MSAGQDPSVKAALHKIEEAQRLLDQAGRDLCPVDGFAEEWRRVCQLYGQAKDLWHAVDERRGALARGRLELSEDAGGPRYALAGRPLHAGDVIEAIWDELEDSTALRFE